MGGIAGRLADPAPARRPALPTALEILGCGTIALLVAPGSLTAAVMTSGGLMTLLLLAESGRVPWLRAHAIARGLQVMGGIGAGVLASAGHGPTALLVGGVLVASTLLQGGRDP